jgi:hypothetical protein
MAFIPTIPQPNDTLDVSQGDLLNNNGALDNVFSIDHLPFSSGSPNFGQHKKLTLTAPLATDPGFSSPISCVYSKLVGAANQLFFQNDATAANVTQLTGFLPNETGNDSKGGVYTLLFLPWALKLFMGQSSAVSGSNNFTLSGFTGFGSSIFTAQANAFGGGAVSSSFTPNSSAKTFNINSSNALPYYWMVITN